MPTQFIFTGTKTFDVPMVVKNANCIAVAGENNNILVIFNKTFAYLHDLNNNGKLMKLIPKRDMKFGGTSIACGNCFYNIIFSCY